MTPEEIAQSPEERETARIGQEIVDGINQRYRLTGDRALALDTEKDPELWREFEQSTDPSDFASRVERIDAHRFGERLEAHMGKKRTQSQRRPPTPEQVLQAVAPSWSPGLPGGSAPAERSRGNKQAGQGSNSIREAKKLMDQAWSKIS